MTLGNQITDKRETDKHAIVKWLIYRECIKLGHKAAIEYNTENGAIFDVVDWTTNIVYEPIQPFNLKTIKEKTAKYTLVAGVNDMIPVDLDKFSMMSDLHTWIKKIKKIVV